MKLLRDARVAVDQAERVRAELDRIKLNPMAPVDDGYQLTLEDFLDEYALNVAALVASKQRDYGPRAINDAPGGALTGINVRLHDKLARAVNLQTYLHPAQNESLFDTYMDIAGYALIAMLYLDGKWPE